MVQLLWTQGANVNVKNDDGSTPLYYASRESKMDIACVLLDHGADMSPRNVRGRTALDAAARVTK
jgi:uncharacterized protein